MDYAVLGDSVILAQRLESAAPPGETYLSETTARLTEGKFELEPDGELHAQRQERTGLGLAAHRRAPGGTQTAVTTHRTRA